MWAGTATGGGSDLGGGGDAGSSVLTRVADSGGPSSFCTELSRSDRSAEDVASRSDSTLGRRVSTSGCLRCRMLVDCCTYQPSARTHGGGAFCFAASLGPEHVSAYSCSRDSPWGLQL